MKTAYILSAPMSPKKSDPIAPAGSRPSAVALPSLALFLPRVPAIPDASNQRRGRGWRTRSHGRSGRVTLVLLTARLGTGIRPVRRIRV